MDMTQKEQYNKGFFGLNAITKHHEKDSEIYPNIPYIGNDDQDIAQSVGQDITEENGGQYSQPEAGEKETTATTSHHK